jgi:uncharacterized protein (DUF697 family)/predicted GTPase
MFERIKRLFSSAPRDAELHERLAELRKRAPVPVFWLFGKTQSGKTSIIKYLTGAEDAEIGQGFKPCTRFSREYDFPSEEAPLIVFLDTRGMDEPGYDPAEDLAKFGDSTHVVLVTVKLLDHALENVLKHLRTIRAKERHRPIILAVTCLHEAYPQQQHPLPYSFDNDEWTRLESLPRDLMRSLNEQKARFAGLYDHLVPIDLTPSAEGFNEPNYGGPRLKEVLLRALPSAFRQTIIQLDQATSELQDLYARHALPHILGYSSLAATAGAIPIPWVDLVILPAIQSRMVFHLARFYGQPLSGHRFIELAGSLCMGMLVRQASREVAKFIPFFGSVASGALAGAATFALGKAFCFYFSAVHKGHTPKAEDLKRYYEEQLAQAEKFWNRKSTKK